MPVSPSNPGGLRGPVFTTPGQGPDLVNPGELIGGASPSSLAVTPSTPATNLWRQVVSGCTVTPAAGGGLAVDVAGGVIAYDGANEGVQPVTSLAIAAADPLLDRYDLVVADNSSPPVVSVLTGTPGLGSAPSDVTKVSLGVVPVPAGATSISTVHSVIITPERVQHINTPQLLLSQSWLYTFVSGALANADPGGQCFGFDATLNASIAHMYIDYAASAQGVVSNGVSFSRWLLALIDIGSFFLMIWDRTDATNWWLCEVTSFTDHSTYADLGITFEAMAVGPPALSPHLPNSNLGCFVQFWGFAPPAATVSSVFGRTGAVVAVKGDYSGCLIKRTIYTSGTSATHTFDTAAHTADMTLVGGGAGGGGATAASGDNAPAGGGGAGGILRKLLTLAAATATYTVGALGGGGNATSDGTAGGDTTLVHNSVTYTAAHGVGGKHATASATPQILLGGAGGATTNGDANSTIGDAGDPGFSVAATVGVSGEGGDALPFGTGGQGVNTTTTGNAAAGHGAGGAGALGVNSAIGQTGGAGVGGLVIIDEYT